MILPTKHVKTDRALLSIGAEIIKLLSRPKTISKLWDDFRVTNQKQQNTAPISYDWFVLSIDLLFILGIVSFNKGLLQKVKP